MNTKYKLKEERNEIARKVMIEIQKENKIWEKYVGLIQGEVNHTYPELYTAGAVLVLMLYSIFHNFSAYDWSIFSCLKPSRHQITLFVRRYDRSFVALKLKKMFALL